MGTEEGSQSLNLGGSETPPKDNLEKSAAEKLPEPGWDQGHQYFDHFFGYGNE